MKKAGFCFILILSFFVLFACASKPPASASSATASAPESSPAPAASAPAPAPAATPPRQQPSQPAASSGNDLILTGAETYTVVRGDTLTKIARIKYRNGFYYPLIMLASGNVRDQDLIVPGMRLTIPRLQPNLDDPKARASMKKYFLEIASITERKRPRDAAGLRSLANSL